MKKVEIYSDGACSGNPGPGGFATILIFKGKVKELSGGEIYSTNNRMELMGVIAGLEALKEPCEVKVTTDSSYVVNAFNKGWLDSWQKKGWKKANGDAVANKELWERLLVATNNHKVTFIHIKGHNGHKYNERCDALAVAERLKIAGK